MSESRVIVVGAGVAGLSAAYRLQQAGHTVTVLETADHVGGKTAAVRRDGFTFNTGATVLAGSYDAMFALAAELGVGDAVFSPPAVIGVVRDGRVHELRGEGLGAIADFVTTGLLSPRSKLQLSRMTGDLLRSRRAAGYDRHAARAGLDTETVADYCSRKLNDEILDHLLAPVLGGIFVVDGARLSVADLWFTMWKVLLGGLRGYRGGMDFFARALAERLDVRLGATVKEVRSISDGVQVAWSEADGDHDEVVNGAVVSTDAPAAARMIPELDPVARRLMTRELDQANWIAVRLGLSRRPATRSLLTVAGQNDLGGIATVAYEHALSEGSAPAGKGLIGVLMYHEWSNPRMETSDEDVLATVLGQLERIEPGITGLVEFSHISRWAPGALRSTHGTHTTIAALDRLHDPDGRIQLAGDYLGMPSVNGSVVSGEAAAKRLAGALRSAL